MEEKTIIEREGWYGLKLGIGWVLNRRQGQKCPLKTIGQREVPLSSAPVVPRHLKGSTLPKHWSSLGKKSKDGRGREDPDAPGLQSLCYIVGAMSRACLISCGGGNSSLGWRLPAWLSGVEGAEPAGVPEPKKQKPSNFTRVERHFLCLFLIKLSMLTPGLHSTI